MRFVTASFPLAVFLFGPPCGSEPRPVRPGTPPLGAGGMRATMPGRSSNVQQGTVKWFDETRGFGFITQDEGSDVFVHYSAIEGTGFKSLANGDRVEFEVSRGPKGLQAGKVRKTN